MKAARQTVAFTSFQSPEHPPENLARHVLWNSARPYEVDLIPDIAHKDLTKENIAALKKQGYRTYVWTNLETKRLLNVAVRFTLFCRECFNAYHREYKMLERLDLLVESSLVIIIIQK